MLRYGFHEAVLPNERTQTQIQTSMNTAFFDEARAQQPNLQSDIDIAERAGTIVVKSDEDHQDGLTLCFDFSRGFRKHGQQNKSTALRASTNVLVAVCNTWTEDGDPLLQARIGSKPIADARLAMAVKLRWPDLQDRLLAHIATKRMRAIANDLRYASDVSKRNRPDMIYAIVERQRGITFETNPVGACSVDSDGSWYEPSESVIELGAQNIYSRQQQIICLAGAIAVAHADELVKD